MPEAIRIIATLNCAAAEVLDRFAVHALTDITGFGLLGHLRNMTDASHVTAGIWADQVPVIPAARQYPQEGLAPGGTANWRFLKDWVDYPADLAQRGAVLAVRCTDVRRVAGRGPGSNADDVVAAIVAAGTLAASPIGRISGRGDGRIVVTRHR